MTEAEREYVKIVVRRLYDAQKLRIQNDLRLQRLIRDGIVVKESAEADFKDAIQAETQAEREYERIVWRSVKNERVVQEWLANVRGIGPRLSGLLVALIGDIGRFDNVSRLWAYAGLHVKDGRAVKRARGEKANWSAELKTTCWKIATSFVRLGGPYRDLYDTYKAYLIAREVRNGTVIWTQADGKWTIAHRPKSLADQQIDPPKQAPEWTLRRIDNMAKRRTVKLFLAHLYEVWRKMEGLPADGHFAKDRLGHDSYVDPWSMVTKTPTEEAA